MIDLGPPTKGARHGATRWVSLQAQIIAFFAGLSDGACCSTLVRDPAGDHL